MRKFSVGKGAPGKQRRAQWRGPGIILRAVRGNYFVAMPGSVIKAATEQLRHRTAEEQGADRVVLRDLRRTADVLRETSSAKNFQDITEQDWPDGDLNTTAGGAESSQEIPENQPLPDRRRLVRKTPPSKVDGTLPDPRDGHVTQAPADSTSQHELPTSVEQLEVRQPTVELETTPFVPVLEPVSRPTESSETTEPRAKQPRIGD